MAASDDASDCCCCLVLGLPLLAVSIGVSLWILKQFGVVGG